MGNIPLSSQDYFFPQKLFYEGCKTNRIRIKSQPNTLPLNYLKIHSQHIKQYHLKMDNLVKIMGQAIFCYQLSRNAPCRQQKGTLNISKSKKQAPYHFTSTLQTPGSSPLERPSRNLFSNYTDATDIHKFEAAKHWVCFRSITKQKAKSLPCISSCFSLFSPIFS